MSTFVDITPGTPGSVCVICTRAVGIVQPFEPFGNGIRHHTCEPACRGCGQSLPRYLDQYESEVGEIYCATCYESLIEADEVEE